MGLDTPLLDKGGTDEDGDAGAPSCPPPPSAPVATAPPPYEDMQELPCVEARPSKTEPASQTMSTTAPPPPYAPGAAAMLELCSGCSAKMSSTAKFCGTCGAANSGSQTSATGEGGGFLVQLPPGAAPGQEMRVVVPPNLPYAGQPTTFKVPPGVSAGQQVRVPFPGPVPSGGQGVLGAVAPGCFRVQLPSNFAGIEQELQVIVPTGYMQSGQPVRFKVPHDMKGGDYIDVPLPPVLSATPAPGHFRVKLPPQIDPGQLLTVTVPRGYQQAGMSQTFRLPTSATPGGLVDVPLPIGGPGVYHSPAAGARATAAGEPVRGVVISNGTSAPPASQQPDTRHAEPPVKNYNV